MAKTRNASKPAPQDAEQKAPTKSAAIVVGSATADDGADLTITVVDGVVAWPDGIFLPGREKMATLAYESVTDPPRPQLGWTMDPVSAAIALAYHLGARDIRLYGLDISEVKEFEGCASCRDEKPAWMADTRLGLIYLLSKWLKDHGATLTNGGLP